MTIADMANFIELGTAIDATSSLRDVVPTLAIPGVFNHTFA
ncbi:hypothetical protein [Lentzea sp. NPDC060358]